MPRPSLTVERSASASRTEYARHSAAGRSINAYAMARMLGAVIDEGIIAASRTLDIYGRPRSFLC